MRLNLNDFEELISLDSKEKSKEEIEKFYIEKIAKQKKEFEEKIENIKNEYFQKGFVEGSQKKEKELSVKIENIKNDLTSKHKEEVEKLKKIYKDIENALILKNRDYLEKLSTVFVDNLGEMFRFLYIQDSNIKEIKNELHKILDEFKEESPLVIRVSENLYKNIKDEFGNIKVDDKLKDKDFVVEFLDFKIESKIREKIELLKDEIQREIKKLT